MFLKLSMADSAKDRLISTFCLQLPLSIIFNPYFYSVEKEQDVGIYICWEKTIFIESTSLLSRKRIFFS
jgi:hypothetical protein